MAETVKRLKEAIPGIRIAIIAHGDYCDSTTTYVTKIKDFTTDAKQICSFVENVGATGNMIEQAAINIQSLLKAQAKHYTQRKVIWT